MWDPPLDALLERPGRRNGIDFSRASLDGSLMAENKGAATGPNPTVRGKPGTQRYVPTDAEGIPFTLTLTRTDVHDS